MPLPTITVKQTWTAALRRMVGELGDVEGPDIGSARALIESLLEHGVKLEQERS